MLDLIRPGSLSGDNRVMAAGVTTKLWELADLMAVLEEGEASQS